MITSLIATAKSAATHTILDQPPYAHDHDIEATNKPTLDFHDAQK